MSRPTVRRRARGRHRFAILGLELVIAFQGALAAALPQPVPVQAAPAPLGVTAPGVPAAGTSCTVTAGSDGGMLSSCPDATSYADFASGLQLAFEATRGASSTSKLTVGSTPAGATVLVNGLQAGLTPLDTTLPAGSYLVRVTKDGFVPFSKTVTITADKPGSVSATLELAGGGQGSFEWLHASTLVALGGVDPTGQLEVSDFVRDKDGTYYVTYTGLVTTQFTVDPPVDAPPYISYNTKPRISLRYIAIVKSADKGASWTLVKSWKETFSIRTWTSGKFTDGSWDPAAEKLSGPKDHYLRAFYKEQTSESWSVGTMVPLKDGGVVAQVTHVLTHVPQSLEADWDNVGTQQAPTKYMGSGLIENAPAGGVLRTQASGNAISKYGMSAQDLATYNAEVTTTDVRLNLATGAETPMTVSGGPSADARTKPGYQGSYNGTEYWLAFGTAKSGEPLNTKSYIYSTKDGGATLTLDRTYDLGSTEVVGFGHSEDLRIGPDGSLYVLNQSKGSVWILEGTNGTLRLLGTAPAASNAGVVGGNNGPYLSADFDSAGNVLAAYRSGLSSTDNSKINAYFQFFPRTPVKVTSVTLLTQASCPACDSLRAFLKESGVQFQENPADLPSAVAASAAAAAGTSGYPVLVRVGDDTVVKGGADVVSASRILGLSKPALITSYQPRVSNMGNPSGTSGSLTLQPQWVLMVVENDQPKVVLDLREGVSAFAESGGQWTSSVVLSTPPSVQDEQRIVYSKRYPRFPGGGGGLASATQREMPFNKITKLADLVYLYNSEQVSVPDGLGGSVVQMGYTLWTTEQGETSSAYRAIATVSQLIPATEFSIGLGPKGSAGAVKGELAAYVTAQGLVSDGADRFYRVAVDLRKQDEVAVDGNIAARAIGGSIEVKTTAADGSDETREIAMVLLVDNSRLRVSEPGPGGKAMDITSEAVHFTGPDERWVVTNNLGLPNTIPCGSDKALTVAAHSTATFKLADVAAQGVGSCLSGIEVAPTQLLGCETWDDAQLVLSAQTIDALTQSLVLEQTEGRTNWELAFGTRDATIQRIISIDHLVGTAPHCASELENATSAVVAVTGRILGDQEDFKPALKVVDAGRDAVTTAPLAQPGSLAWERDWLEFEATYLELTLKTSIADEALAKLMFLTTAGKKLGYQRQLLAVRALLHCNYEGTALPGVLGLVARTAAEPDAVKAAAVCLQDFVLHPMKHWQTYDRTLWAGGAFETSFLGTVINTALAANPTVGFLAAAAAGSPVTYGDFVLARAADLEKKAASDPIYADQATDFALDHYGRVMTASARELTGTRGAITRAVILAGPVERQAVAALLDCAKTFGIDNPFGKLAELTTSRSYTAGIPCVDKAASGQPRIDAYRLVAAGLHSGLFGALLEAAGRDLDLLYSALDLTVKVIADVDAVEKTYPAGTTVAKWKADLPALDRLEIVRRHAEGVVAARGHQITVREAASILAGLTECGAGLVKGLFSGEGVLLLGLGVGAAIAGPTAAAVGGVAFLLSGVAFTGLAATSLAQTWEGLDLVGKTAGICGVAMSAVMTATAVAGLRVAVRGWTPAELRYSPPKMISLKTILNRGRGQAMPLEEQGAALGRRSGYVVYEEPPIEAPVPPETSLQAVLNAIPLARQAVIRGLAQRLDYTSMSTVTRGAFDELAKAYGEPSGVAAVQALRKARLDTLQNDVLPPPGALDAWFRIGGAMIAELLPGIPKSLRVEATVTGLAGSDAELVLAALGDGQFPKVTGNQYRGVSTPDLQAGTSVMQAFLRSDRLLQAIDGPAGGRALTAEEASYLAGLQKASQAGSRPALLASLAKSPIVDALREGIAGARTLNAVPPAAKLTALTGDYITAGVFKDAYRLRATFEGVANPVEIAVKKGIITDEEFALLTELSQKGLTQKPFLKAPLKNVDGAEALAVEEWVPGDSMIRMFGQPGMSAAVGQFEALLFLRTLKGSGAAARAYFNADLHWNNVKVYVEGASVKARAIDFDPQFTKQATADQYWASTLMRRRNAQNFVIQSMSEYLQGVLDAFSSEPGSSRDAGLAILRRARAVLADPALQADALSLQSYPGVTDLAAGSKVIVADLDAFLAGK